MGFAPALAPAIGAAAAPAAATALPAIGMGAADLAAAGALGGGLLAPSTASAAPGIFGVLSGMGPEQAAMIAQQNAGMGLGADLATMSSAGYASGAPMAANLIPGAFDTLGKFSGAMNKLSPAIKASGLLGQDQPRPMPGAPEPMPNMRAQQRRFPRRFGPY